MDQAPRAEEFAVRNREPQFSARPRSRIRFSMTPGSAHGRGGAAPCGDGGSSAKTADAVMLINSQSSRRPHTRTKTAPSRRVTRRASSEGTNRIAGKLDAVDRGDHVEGAIVEGQRLHLTDFDPGLREPAAGNGDEIGRRIAARPPRHPVRADTMRAPPAPQPMSRCRVAVAVFRHDRAQWQRRPARWAH